MITNLHDLGHVQIPFGMLGLALEFPRSKYVWKISKQWLYVENERVNESVPNDSQWIDKYLRSKWGKLGILPPNVSVK